MTAFSSSVSTLALPFAAEKSAALVLISSLSLLEALSLGVKCLVSDIPENTTVTADYGTAFRTEGTDSLARALERDTAQPLTPEQSKAQLDYVRANFDYDIMLDRYEEAYHHVTGDPLKAMPSHGGAV